MQTFLPLPDFRESARVLDDKRLGKQRVEVLQILRALDGVGKPWSQHPAVRMWRGCEPALIQYGLRICYEWMGRGFIDSVCIKLEEKTNTLAAWTAIIMNRPEEIPMPKWFGNEKLHASHRSNLLRKNPTHYGQFGWSDPSDLPYHWPR